MPRQAQSIFPAAECGFDGKASPCSTRRHSHDHPDGRGCGRAAGHPAQGGLCSYVVGGCVRDSLLGLTPHDWDLCTSALPQQVMELFGAQRCIPTGLQHGTVTVKQSGALYEITTFRTEGTYTDGRHPDEVHFVAGCGGRIWPGGILPSTPWLQ